MSPVALIADGGWIVVGRQAAEQRLCLRVDERSDGRLHIVEIWLTDSRGLSGAHLRDLPLGAWESQINAPVVAAAWRSQSEMSGNMGADEAARRHASLVQELQTATGSTDADGLDFRLPAGDAAAVAIMPEPSLRIEVPAGIKRADDFYRSVAEAYSWLAGRERRPAKALSEANGVPESTIHRWVKEARRRGLLGPGRRASTDRPVAPTVSTPAAVVVYDPASPETREWAQRARRGLVSEWDIANDPLLRAFALRLRQGEMSYFEKAVDPIVRAVYARLDDDSLPATERDQADPLARLVLSSPTRRQSR